MCSGVAVVSSCSLCHHSTAVIPPHIHTSLPGLLPPPLHSALVPVTSASEAAAPSRVSSSQPLSGGGGGGRAPVLSKISMLRNLNVLLKVII